jgi:hypothetical protein
MQHHCMGRYHAEDDGVEPEQSVGMQQHAELPRINLHAASVCGTAVNICFYVFFNGAER